MGKTKKLYLAKRIMAMILAAAMSVTMVPQTALAAPADDPAEIAIDADGSSGAADADNNADDAADADNDADVPADGGTGASADTDVPADGSTGDGVADNGTTTATGDETADQNAGGAETQEDAPAPATAVYEISIGNMLTEAVYDGYAPFDTDEAVVTKTVNGQTTNVTGETVTPAWQVQGADGNFTALAGNPVNAGTYKLTLTCAEAAGVHNALTKEVTCTITKAPLTIKAAASAKPGAKADKANVTVAVTEILMAEGDAFAWSTDILALEVTGVREAYGSALTADDVLKKDGDYVADVTVSLKADASADAKAAWNNYTVEPFTADVVMADLVETRVIVTLAEKWREAGKVTLHVYDGAAAELPKLTEDYTVVVQYKDDTTTPASWKDLTGAEAVGEWDTYTDCKRDENGKVLAPTDADEYTYFFTYEDTKEGKYNNSNSDSITVVIDPAPVTVEITNTEKLAFPAGTKMAKVLSKVTYKATTKDRKDAVREIKAEAEHIWGTGYDDKNVSQIYEPVFTLQIKNGNAWQNIDDANYKLVGGKEYRVIYDGKKAIYNADGSYAHRTGINSGLDDIGEEINGMNGNYITDETPTADDKALQIEAQPSAEMEWDLTALLADGKAGKTVEEATAKDFDDKGLYEKKDDYKSKVKLKNADKTLEAVGSDFTYTWYKHNKTDLLDKQIWDQNKTNGFESTDFYDDGNWSSKGSIVAPSDAGIYKLEISYQDNTDDDTLYTVKDDAKAIVYYVINKVALTVTPETGTYETLAGRSPYDYFVREKKIDEIKYTVKKGAEDYKFPESLGEVVPQWGVLENITVGTEVDTTAYEESRQDLSFKTDAGYAYEIQAQNLGRRVYDPNGEYEYFNSSISKILNNYTLSQGVKKENEIGGKMYAYRDDVSLSGKVALTVKPMGTTELTFAKATPVAYEKIYDGKALTKEEVKPETAYTLTANGQTVTDLDVTYTCVEKEDDGYGYSYSLEAVRNAGEYELYVNFAGDETYKALTLAADEYYGKLIGTIQIKKREITLSLDVDDTYEAGYVNALWEDAERKLTVTGCAEADEWAFSIEAMYYGNGAWGDLQFYVNKKGSKTPLYDGDILSKGGEFEIHYDAENSYLSDWNAVNYARNYEIKDATAVLDTFKTVAKPAGVTSAALGSTVKQLNIVRTKLERNETTDDITQTYDVREGIPYVSYSGMTGNLAAFRIDAPEEFDRSIPDTAMYKNEIEKIGGKVFDYRNSGYFVALFDAAEGEKKVNIRWADKYIETIIFKLDQKLCLGNLSKAVAPKSLAFNGAPKKLAVGESVQLDVKITKKQMTDVIWLGYESSDETVMHVDPDSGYVTALKKDKATITVYPKQLDKDGKAVKIPGFKAVTVTIDGTALTVPKAVKATPHGNYALVNYDRVTDGYRREIYVVEGKMKPTDIETKVKSLRGNKNQWRGTFAIAPLYLDSADESLIRTNNDVRYKAWLSGLQKEKEYTVYVRNVCEAKTLSDGYVITQATVDESAAGTAVSFKTQKAEVRDLVLELDETLDGIDFMENDYSGCDVYRVELSKFLKGLESKTFGSFDQRESDTAADSVDRIWLELPLKDKKGAYQDPKLEYYVYAKDKNGANVKASKNDFLSVDKKGKLKLTGVTGWTEYDAWNDDWYYGGGVYVYVRDVNTGRSDQIKLVIVADADSVTAKKKTVNMTVGQTQDLNDIALYSYKMGKTKLSSYQWPDMDMAAVREAVKAQSEYFELIEGDDSELTVLRAIKAGGKLELSLTDETVKKNAANAENATAKITFLSKDLAQVKKIKAVDVTNEKFGLTFTAAGYPDAFRVEIRDASGNMLLDKRYTIYDENNNASGKVYEVWERAKDRNGEVRVKDAFRIDADTIKADVAAAGTKNRLAKESQYTVKITALCGGVSSKEATAKVKTTKIPAVQDGLYDEDGWYWNCDKKCWVWDPYDVLGGMSIQVSEYGTELSDSNQEWLYVLSGNSYTLTAEPTNRGRVNDTLVWTIGDKKVASVKAAAGTYCITLKGLQPGRTTLEVKSKILNKTIARYGIRVAAIGDAYDNGSYRYYGDDEGENPGEAYDPGHFYDDDAPVYLPLSVGDQRKTFVSGSYDYGGFFSFTAPEAGKYAFRAGNSSVFRYKKLSKSATGWSYVSTNGDLGWMQEGQTIWLKSQYSSSTPYYVWVEQTERMEPITDGMTVTGTGNQATLQFKAPKAGVYQFTLTNSSDAKQNLYLYTDVNQVINNSTPVKSGDTIIYELTKDETVWLKTASYLPSGQTYTLGAADVTPQAVPTEAVSIPANGSKLYAFTAQTAGIYRLAVTVPTANASGVELKVWDDAMAAITGDGSPLKTVTSGADAGGNTTLSVDLILEAGQTVYLNPVNSSAAAVSVSVSGTPDTSITTVITEAGTPINATAAAGAKATFTAQKTGIYTFTTTEALTQDVTFHGWTSGEYDPTSGNANVSATVTSGDSLSQKVFLKAEQMIVWTMSVSTDVTFTMKAEADEELKLGQSAQATVLGSNEAPDRQATAAGFIFTAPEAGYYSFWSSDTEYDTYGYLWDVDAVNVNTCLLNKGTVGSGNESGYLTYDDDGANNRQFGISYNLRKGQKVYLKCIMYNNSYSDTFTVHVASGQNAWRN